MIILWGPCVCPEQLEPWLPEALSDGHFAEEVADGEVLVAMSHGLGVFRHVELSCRSLAVQYCGGGCLTCMNSKIS